MRTHHEIEATYAPEPSTAVPDLTELPGVATVEHDSPFQLVAEYVDTDDLALVRAGVTLRRRTGGVDEGWHLKVPTDDGRLEHHEPLGHGTAAPESFRGLADGWIRGRRLVTIATISTERTTTRLLDADGLVLAELVDDHVTATNDDGHPRAWREWELELVDGTADLLTAADDLFAANGVHRAEVDRKIERALGDRLPDQVSLARPRAGKPTARLVHTRLVDQVDRLARRDAQVRQGRDVGVHQMRIAIRRLRALLATYRSVLDRDVTDPLRDELKWLAHQLAESRDATVVLALLLDELDDLADDLVIGPVRERLDTELADAGRRAIDEALASDRYRRLRADLDTLITDTPWTDGADAPAGDVAARRIRKEMRRVLRRASAADDETADAADRPHALHELRKAIKRLRYAAEAARPIDGRAVRKLVKCAKRSTSALGDVQDATVAAEHVFRVALAADRAGEPSFTYGVLHARVEALGRDIEDVDVDDLVKGLGARSRRARDDLAR